MRSSAFVVNTARGDLINERALHDALVEGRIAGAALDVYNEEPYVGPLASLPNTILTAHAGGYTVEARDRMETESVTNVLRLLAAPEK